MISIRLFKLRNLRAQWFCTCRLRDFRDCPAVEGAEDKNENAFSRADLRSDNVMSVAVVQAIRLPQFDRKDVVGAGDCTNLDRK